MALSSFRTLSLIGVLALGAGIASGQAYPNKPIRIVTPDVGGSNDTALRFITPGLTAGLRQQVIVENRGGNIVIPTLIVTRASPDGYTLYYNGANVWLEPYLRDNVPYDPVKDLAPIALTVRVPVVLVAHPSLPVNSVKELIAMAKARPGELNYASGISGSSNHIAMELFKSLAGLNLVRIPYSGTGPALNAVIGGEVKLSFPGAGAAMPHVKSGRLKLLGVASAEPSALLPGVTTVAAAGLPGFAYESRQGMWAPAGTPAAIIRRVNQEVVRVLRLPEVVERFRNAATETVGSSPEEFAAAIKAEMAALGKVIKDAGIRDD